jgi:hypothetical protein
MFGRFLVPVQGMRPAILQENSRMTPYNRPQLVPPTFFAKTPIIILHTVNVLKKEVWFLLKPEDKMKKTYQ